MGLRINKWVLKATFNQWWLCAHRRIVKTAWDLALDARTVKSCCSILQGLMTAIAIIHYSSHHTCIRTLWWCVFRDVPSSKTKLDGSSKYFWFRWGHHQINTFQFQTTATGSIRYLLQNVVSVQWELSLYLQIVHSRKYPRFALKLNLKLNLTRVKLIRFFVWDLN